MNGVRVKDVSADTVRYYPTLDNNDGVYDQRPGGMAAIVGGNGAIVLHTTEGWDSYQWLRCCNGVSCHKLFTRDGRILKMVSEEFRAWHAGRSRWGGRSDWNDFSLGYEIEHKLGGVAITEIQYEAIAQSIAYDCARFHIYDYWVRFHREVALPRGRKIDPTDYDSSRVWRRVMEIRANWPLAEWGIPMWFRPDRNVAPAYRVAA